MEKETADELMQKYDFVYIANYTSRNEVKQCALIAVDEIFFALKYNLDGATSGSVKYWTEVKQEIENL